MAKTIIQKLIEIQKQHRYLTSEALQAASEEIDEPLCRLHEVASFFPHFKLKPPPRTEVHVCRDLACHLRDAKGCRKALEQHARVLNAKHQDEKDDTNKAVVHGVSCLGRCDEPVAIMINDQVFAGQTTQEYMELMTQAHEGETIHPPEPDRRSKDWKIDPYKDQPKYGALRKFLQDWKELKLNNPQFSNKTPSELLRDSYKSKQDEGLAEHLPNTKVALQENPAFSLIQELLNADLRGMGGPGENTAKKWQAVVKAELNPIDDETLLKCAKRNVPAPIPTKYVVCNGDESEPGTFKDRELLLRYPHLVIEGIVLGGLTTGASEGYIYIRHEYHEQIEAVNEAIKELREIGLCGNDIDGTGLAFEFHDVFVSPGGYICGEQNALLAAMEDKRAEPKNKVLPTMKEGYRGQPTLVNNVETFAWVPSISQKRGKWYAEQARVCPESEKFPKPGAGLRGGKGWRFVSICGDVVKPGVYEVPYGQSVRELIDDCAGGLRPGRKLKAIAMSGPSGGFLPLQISPKKLSEDLAKELVVRKVMISMDESLDILNLPLDKALFGDHGRALALGAAFVVYDDTADLLDQALNCVEFFRNESCGKCVPCRIGSVKLAQILKQTMTGKPFDKAEEDRVKELGNVLKVASICGLGQVVPAAIASVIRYFPNELQRQPKSAGVNHVS